MFVTYGPVQLSQVRTMGMSMRRVTDATGLDELHREVTLELLTVWNPFATASNTRNVGNPPFDPLGVTINNLKSLLTRDRQLLTIKTGAGDKVFQVPLTGPNGQPLPCDPMGGPFVDDCRVLEVEGDNTAIVFLRIRFAYNDSTNFCVSHRWTVRSEVDGKTFLTNRIVEGRATFRLDKLLSLNPAIVPDQFRRFFFMAPPAGFIRKGIKAIATPDGREVAYSYVDKQLRLNLGTFPWSKIEGDATSGVDWPFKELKGVIGAIGTFIAGVKDAKKNGLLFGGVGEWAKLIPTAKSRAVVRVYGNVKASFTVLTNLGLAVCLDRFAPLSIFNSTLFPVSCFVTQDLNNENGPFVRVIMEFLPISGQAFKAMVQPGLVGALINNNADILFNGGPTLAGQNPALGNPPLPASGNTRGTWLGYLVAQALIPPGQNPGTLGPPPPVPTDGVPARNDAPGLV